MDKKRIDYIDTAKGIGIILVVVGHLFADKNVLVNFIYSFHMPLFFFISGLTLATRQSDIKVEEMALSKWRSLMRPYFFFCLFSFFLSSLAGTYKDVYEWAISTLTFKGVSVLWFLPALYVSYILFAVYKTRISNAKIKHAVIGFAALLPLLAGIYILPEFSNEGIIGTVLYNLVCLVLRGLFGFFFMAFGYRIQKLYSAKNQDKTVEALDRLKYGALGMVGLLLVFVLSFFNGAANMFSMTTKSIILFLVCAIAGSVSIVLISVALPGIKPLMYAGKNSLIIMVTHADFFVCHLSALIALKVSAFINVKGVFHLTTFMLIALFSWILCMLLNPVISLLTKASLQKPQRSLH